MALFSAQHLQKGVESREVWSWAAFDFANSGYTTVVLTAVFNAYFVSVIAQNADWATLAWTSVIGVSNALCILLMPLIGAIADDRGNKKWWLFWATLICIVGTLGLMATGPGTILLAAFLITLSNIGFNVGETLNSAFLPELAQPEAMGKVSGWGWSFGYCGGLVTLGLSLLVFAFGDMFGLSFDEQIAGTMAITAFVFLISATPLFLFLKERSTPRSTQSHWSTLARESFRELKETFKSLPEYQDFARLSLCGFLFQSGIAVVVTLSAVFASVALGFKTEDTLLLVFVVNITAAVGAFGFGYLEDLIGHKKALAITLVLWILMVLIAGTTSSIFWFWVAANMAGLAMGSCQSAGRAMVGVLSPESKRASFYSFWNMALWVSNIVGPMTYGVVTWLTSNNHRLAILVTGVFFILALGVLCLINLERGQQLAQKK